MDGRRPLGIMYVNTHVLAPDQEVEYDRWYQDVHFADVTAPGIFVQASMFHNASSPPPPDEGRFLAFYECMWSDLEAASRAFSRHVETLWQERRIHAGTAGRLFGIYRPHEWLARPERRPRSQSLLAEHLDCADPARAPALLEWYARKRLPAALELGLHHTVSISERVYGGRGFGRLARDPRPGDPGDPDPEQPRFLALYESDRGDPRWLARELERQLAHDPLPDFARLRRASTFYRARP
jgi:hypothetical protein